ncbi:MAG: YjbQ family protein [Gaiellales bacterium]|nr:MAG: YjbQ family protein [Gaiellales bacterium]
MTPEDSRTTPEAGFVVHTRELEFPMREELDIVDVTAEVAGVVDESKVRAGTATIFAPGATGVVTCLEYEPGVLADFREAIERIAPISGHYQHNVFQDDGNGHSHVRAGLMGPSLVVPVVENRMTLGTWQQIVIINCDNRRRDRRLVVTVTGV